MRSFVFYSLPHPYLSIRRAARRGINFGCGRIRYCITVDEIALLNGGFRDGKSWESEEKGKRQMDNVRLGR